MDGIATQMTATTTSTANFGDTAAAMEAAKESATKSKIKKIEFINQINFSIQ